ncbi:hypothetical protein ACIBXA_20600 [Micromonospora echinaurantiaca]|uniref:hypothetical protein n=1 Tax=Micromonospora echinaurantiaca TaxID=47857 RepID=UPI0037B6E13D
MAGWPTYCARCGGPAIALVEAGHPGTGHYRAETTCHRHTRAAHRWASAVGPTRTIPIGPTQAALFELPEVTR